MLVHAARRFALVLGSIAAATAAISAALGALAGASIDRSISLGLDLAGSFLLVGAFFIGNRNPFRNVGGHTLLAFWARKGVRAVSPEERRGELNSSVLYLAIGLCLILIGLATDSRVRLV